MALPFLTADQFQAVVYSWGAQSFTPSSNVDFWLYASKSQPGLPPTGQATYNSYVATVAGKLGTIQHGPLQPA